MAFGFLGKLATPLMRRWMSVVSHSGTRPLDLCKEAALDTYVFMVPGARPC